MVFSFDATGFGNSQLTTVALRNPYKRATSAPRRRTCVCSGLGPSPTVARAR